jgi:hypothetical protein
MQILKECQGNVKDAIDFLLPGDLFSEQPLDSPVDAAGPANGKRRPAKRAAYSRGIPLELVLSDDEDAAAQANARKWNLSDVKPSEWETGQSKFSLQSQREELKKEFRVFLGEEVVGEVLRAHATIHDARRELRYAATCACKSVCVFVCVCV